MPWRCPACQTEIRHTPLDPQPKAGERYRCHICRLELEYNAASDQLAVTALDADRVNPIIPDDPVHPVKPRTTTVKARRR